MANPLVRAVGLQQLLDAEAQKAPATEDIPVHAESALASTVRQSWERNKLAKTKVDIKMLKCLRARRGVYSSSELGMLQANGAQNIIWADITETKCRAASAWIREIELPVGERSWAVEPTPIPDLPHPMNQSIVEKSAAQARDAMMQMFQGAGQVMDEQSFRDMANELADELRVETLAKLKDKAEVRAKRMEDTIADRMADGGWDEAMDAFTEDFVTYPTACLKGPFYARHKALEWGDGWLPHVSDKPVQKWAHVSPFDIYPAPAAKSAQDGNFIERMRFWREDLYALKGLPGYHDEEIDKALLDYSGGHLEGWLWTEAERNRLEQETLYLWLSPPGVIDALNFWGNVPGWQLMSWGVKSLEDGPLDPTRDYEVNALLCGRYVLYAAINPNPLGIRPYFTASYDTIPNAFWGRSLPELAETSQKMCNSIICALADNLAYAAGPMVWVHADRFADGEDTVDIFPWKVWQLKSDPTQGANPGIGFFQADDRSGPLMQTYDKWEMKADDTTGVPRYTYGNAQVGGAGDTATGLAMLLNNAAKGLRRAIASIDMRVVQPSVYLAFVHEMLYNDDPTIKGDANIVPRGAAAILIKESTQQRRTQFLAMTANPVDMAIIGQEGRAELLRETCAAMELPVDKIVPSNAEIKKRQAQQAQMQQQQQAAQAQAMQANQQGDMERTMAVEQAKNERAQADNHAKNVNTVLKEMLSRRTKAIDQSYGTLPQ